MKPQLLGCLVGLSLAVVANAQTAAPSTLPPEVPYPDGYRRWAHVASAVVGTKMSEPGKPAEDDKSGPTPGLIHNLYANDLALLGYRTGKFPEGAVLIADWFFLEETRGGLKQGARKSVDVMIRDARYADTGGWGFENFEKNSRTQRNVGTKAVTSCFECHRRAGAEQEFVFSKWLP